MKHFPRLRPGFPRTSVDALEEYTKAMETQLEMASSTWPLGSDTSSGNLTVSLDPSNEYLRQLYIPLDSASASSPLIIGRGDFNWLMITPDGSVSIDGMNCGLIGVKVWITNNSDQDSITILNQSTALENINTYNGFLCSGNADFVIGPLQTVLAIHDGFQWRIGECCCEPDRWVQITNTTAVDSISPGASATVTPTSMIGIFPFAKLTLGTGTPQQETVTVISVTPTDNPISFVATVVNSHPVGETIIGAPTTSINSETIEPIGYWPGVWYVFTAVNNEMNLQTTNVWIGEPNNTLLIPNWFYRGQVADDTAPDGTPVIEVWTSPTTFTSPVTFNNTVTFNRQVNFTTGPVTYGTEGDLILPNRWANIVRTTMPEGVSNTGEELVLVANLNGIWPGVNLFIEDGGAHPAETVTVISVGPGNMFTAIFSHDHNAGATVTGAPTLVGPLNTIHWPGSWYIWFELSDTVNMQYQGNTWLVDPNQNPLQPNFFYFGQLAKDQAVDGHDVTLVVNFPFVFYGTMGVPPFIPPDGNTIAFNYTTGVWYWWNGTMWVAIGGTSSNYWAYYRHTATKTLWYSENFGLETPTVSGRRYWIAGLETTTGFNNASGTSLNPNFLYAVPFISPGGGIISSLAISIQNVVGTFPGWFKFGIWTASGRQMDGSWSNYPDALALETQTTGWVNGNGLTEVKTALNGSPIMFVTQPNVLYWLGFAFNANVAQIVGVELASQFNLGFSSDPFGCEAFDNSFGQLMPIYCLVPFTWSGGNIDPTPQFSTFPDGAFLNPQDFFPFLGFGYYNTLDGP